MICWWTMIRMLLRCAAACRATLIIFVFHHDDFAITPRYFQRWWWLFIWCFSPIMDDRASLRRRFAFSPPFCAAMPCWDYTIWRMARSHAVIIDEAVKRWFAIAAAVITAADDIFLFTFSRFQSSCWLDDFPSLPPVRWWRWCTITILCAPCHYFHYAEIIAIDARHAFRRCRTDGHDIDAAAAAVCARRLPHARYYRHYCRLIFMPRQLPSFIWTIIIDWCRLSLIIDDYDDYWCAAIMAIIWR